MKVIKGSDYMLPVTPVPSTSIHQINRFKLEINKSLHHIDDGD